MMEETRLAAYIAGMTSGNYAFIYKIDDSLEKELRINVSGNYAFIYKIDDSLEKELRINVVFYEYEKEQEKTEG